MNPLAHSLEQYLALRRSLGYQLDDAARLLPRFVAWMSDQGQETVMVASALAWCQAPEVPLGSTVHSRRMTAVRGFARYLSGIDPATQVPPLGLLPSRQRWQPPFVYSQGQIADLMQRARNSLDHRLPAATYETLIGLLATAGLRIGEAIRLDRADIDWNGGVLLIRESKFGKTRYVPLQPDATTALGAYARNRDGLHPRPHNDAFFLTITGKRLIYPAVSATFRNLVRETGIGSGAKRNPRLHDLRHTFAVNTLIDWYRRGEDVHVRMPYLAAYLGHRDPRYTYWYLSAAPELLALAAGRLEQHPWTGIRR